MTFIFRYVFDVEARERVRMIFGIKLDHIESEFNFYYGSDERYVLLDSYYPWALLEGGIRCIK